jgi:hypothetical protein
MDGAGSFPAKENHGTEETVVRFLTEHALPERLLLAGRPYRPVSPAQLTSIMHLAMVMSEN